MAYSNKDIVDFLAANPNLTDAEIGTIMQNTGITLNQIANALAENAQESGYQTQTVANAETGQLDINTRDLGAGFNAYQDESGKTSGFSRVDPARPDMIQLYDSNGNYLGQEKVTTTTQDLIKNLGPIALAAGGTALAQGLLGTEGLFGGAGAATGAATGTAGMTAAELAQLDLALGGAGGTAGAESLAAALATGAPVATLTNLTGGSGLLTGAEAGITAQSVADKLAADAALNPAVVTPTGTPTGGGGGGVPTTTTTVPTTTTTVPTTTTTVPTNLSSVLTPAVVKAATGLLGPLVLSKALTPTGTSTPMPTSAIPTQGVPLNSEDYFKAIQANYNQLLPLSNKDVATPLAAWYNSQYGA